MTQNELFVKMIYDRWNALLENCDNTLNSFTDEELLREIAPDRNRGIYLLGHLIAIHDAMLPLLELGNAEHTGLFDLFVTSPDKAAGNIPSAGELRDLWKKQVVSLTAKLESLRPDEWFEKHTAVSAGEFAEELHRNKLNILLTRTSHLSYHLGQLKWLKQLP